MGVGCGSSGFCEGCTDCDASTTNGPTTTVKATTDALTTTEEPCETDADEDFRVDYIGKSTQFRIYNQCNDKQFLKIKMTDLTEYDSNNRKTTNKVTWFASTDWEWDNPNGVNTEYNGYKVVKNTFTATYVVGNADFILTTLLFKEDAVINDNKSVNVNSNGSNSNIKYKIIPKKKSLMKSKHMQRNSEEKKMDLFSFSVCFSVCNVLCYFFQIYVYVFVCVFILK